MVRDIYSARYMLFMVRTFNTHVSSPILSCELYAASLSYSFSLSITHSLSLNHSLSLPPSLSLFLYFFISVSPTHCFIPYSPLLNFRFSARRWVQWACMQAWSITTTSHWASTSSDRIINSCQKNLVQRCGALVIIFMFMYLFPCVHALFESSESMI